MFYVPPTKKIFSYNAVASWGERLSSKPNSEWEKFLATDAEYDGRQVYRSIDHPVEVILETTTATVRFRTEDAGDILVFFYTDATERIHWRSSLAERSVAAPFAVAAMYFVEEFVAEEFAKIPVSVLEAFARNERDGLVAGTGKKSGGDHNPAQEQASVAESESVPARNLELSFVAGTTSLLCTAEWIAATDHNDDGGDHQPCDNLAHHQPGDGGDHDPAHHQPVSCAPALGNKAVSAAELSKPERAQLVRLAAFAREASFSYDKLRAGYVLYGAMKISAFANSYFAKWRQRFKISNPEVLEIFRKAPRELDTEAILRTDSRDKFSLKWDFSLGGTRLSAEERATVVSHAGEAFFLPGRGVVKLRGNAQNFIADWPDQETHGLPIYTLLSLFRNEKYVKISPDAKLSAWRRKFLAEPEVPENMPAFLRPYQTRGAAWIKQMLERGAHPLIADEMGLGKTLQVLTVLSLDKSANASALVVCPASVVPVWKNEIQKFFPGSEVNIFSPHKKNWLRIAVGRDSAGGANPASPLPKISIVSYGNLRRNAGKILRKKFGYAILDEAQFIKNPKTKIAQVCLKIEARRRLALTGTPIENRHLDLWTLFRFLMPGLLGRRVDLEEALAESPDSPEILERLRTQISPFILRRTKSEVAKDLPEKTQNVLFCPMLETQRELYSRIVAAGLEEFGAAAGGEKISAKNALNLDAANLLTVLMRLRQAACDPALLPGKGDLPFEDSGKISVLLERAQEIIDNGGKIVIFSQFVRFLDRVRAALKENFPEIPQFMLTGKTLDRAAPVRDFQAEKGSALFLASLRAGGTGLTLNSAEYVFLLDPWWNPAVEEQAIDRVHRIGQQKRVFVYRMIAAGTVEERVEKLKQSKRELFGSLIGGIPDMSDWAQHYPSLESLIALSE
ncbi:MAG: DEAD/DEAH box helicase [Opitutae bacterium]|nr:DEAD/DEAH box helicase [Opitutae bacterium]